MGEALPQAGGPQAQAQHTAVVPPPPRDVQNATNPWCHSPLLGLSPPAAILAGLTLVSRGL